MKLEVVVEKDGLPLGLAEAGTNVSEQQLLVPALADVPLDLPAGLPVIADKGHDSDAFRDELEAAGFLPIIPHRSNRVKPSRNDARRLRRYRHRWIVERTNAWLHCYRGLATRWAYYPFIYVGLVYVCFIHMALNGFETVSRFRGITDFQAISGSCQSKPQHTALTFGSSNPEHSSSSQFAHPSPSLSRNATYSPTALATPALRAADTPVFC
ncbi:MAG: transposase [Pirellulales bacterium]|nr:transposase [Pirellulales bacterium]